MMNEMREMYEDLILDHNRSPRNYPKKPAGANHSSHGYNPYCGDEFRVHLKIEDGVIKDVGFEGGGCAISTASASLMTEAIKGKTVIEVEKLFKDVHEAFTSQKEPTKESSRLLGKLALLISVKEFPMRVKCATLSWHTMHAAIHEGKETVCTE